MRMIMEVSIPNEPFNTMVRDGSAGKTIQKALEATKPQSVYFTEINGQRGGILIVDVKDPSAIPALSEPWFLSFNAGVKFRIAMTPEELGKSGIDQLGKNW
jgi:hypothetical protein